MTETVRSSPFLIDVETVARSFSAAFEKARWVTKPRRRRLFLSLGSSVVGAADSTASNSSLDAVATPSTTSRRAVLIALASR